MFKLFCSTIILSVLVGGCASKNSLGFFKKDSYYEAAMTQFQTGKIVQGIATRAIINTVYLNGVDIEKYNDKEYFFVATYIDNDFFDIKKKGLNNRTFLLTMNGKTAVTVKRLDDNNALRKSMPLAARWNDYYLVSFPKSDTHELALRYSSKRFGSIILTYEQVKKEI